MKTKKFTIVPIIINERKLNLRVPTDYLKQVLKNAEENNLQETILNLELNDQKLNIPISVSLLRMLLNQSDPIKKIPMFLSNYLVDLTEKMVISPRLPITGRNEEIEKVWFHLSQRKKNNVFLVGDKDVGKTTICYEIARQVATLECPKQFYGARVIMLKPEMLIKVESEFFMEMLVEKILTFLAKNKENVILYIDKSIYMKVDYWMAVMLNSCIVKYNIPIITTSYEEEFEQYFQNDFIIGKYVNRVCVDEPEIENIQSMISNHICKLKRDYGIDISDEVLKYGIFTSDLSNSVSAYPGKAINVFERAFSEAKRKGKNSVDKQCILACYDSYLKLYNSMDENEKRIIAYHEAGHYIVQKMCKHVNNVKIAYVSILPMMSYLGVNATYIVQGKNMNYTKEYMMETISVFLAGRIAEKLITNSYSSGACNDLEVANTIAEEMITVYGLSEESKNRNFTAYDGYFMKDYLLNENNKEALNAEIGVILDEAYKRAEKVINSNRTILDAIAEWLLVEEVLTGEQLEEICEVYK